MSIKQQVAEGLLRIGAVFLRPGDPFTWASGIKSPVYCDNRLTLSAPDVRTTIEDGLADMIRAQYPECEAIFGTSTAGIPHAALVSERLNLPMGYVRAGKKDHGRENSIEGKLVPGSKVVVIEDLISTAGTVVEVVGILREAGAEVLGIASIITYGMKKADERFAASATVNHSLTDFDTLLETAAQTGYISESDIARVKKFRDNPQDQSWMD